MELQELYDRIGLPPEIVSKLNGIQKETDVTQLEDCLGRLMEMQTAWEAYQELSERLGEDPGQFKMLYCQLECARRAYDRYEQRQIPAEIYRETMKCFTRFLEECKKKHGQMFFDRGWWTFRQISLNIFRIGALEYQPDRYEGKPVISIHIPSDADFNAAAVDVSLKQAVSFFQTYFGETDYENYICSSWLLSPALTPLLSEGSRILSFQRRFEVKEVKPEGKEYVEWLYQAPADTPAENLPAVTSLQKKVKELVLRGGSVGSALGVLRPDA